MTPAIAKHLQRVEDQWARLVGTEIVRPDVSGTERAARTLLQAWYLALDPPFVNFDGGYAIIEIDQSDAGGPYLLCGCGSDDFAAVSFGVDAEHVCDELRDAFDRIARLPCRIELRDQNGLLIGASSDGVNGVSDDNTVRLTMRGLR